MTRDAVDPEDLINERPAVVEVTKQGTVYVADARVRDSGWLRVKEWDGQRAMVPPHRVVAVRRVETEHYGERDTDGRRSIRVADEKWRQEAKQDPDEIGGQPVVADD
jgi:hypothetical protein